MAKTFTLENINVTILRNFRVPGENFGAPGYIADGFEIDLPVGFNLYPNQPGLATNHYVMYCYGLVDTPDDGGGVRRGADFRPRFWRGVAKRLATAQLALRLGKTIKQLTQADFSGANATERRLFNLSTEPLDVRGFSLDEAVRQLCGLDPELRSSIPHGTEALIDCDYRVRVTGAPTETENGAITVVRHSISSAIDSRVGLRFPLSSITAGSTINNSLLTVDKTTETVAAGEDLNVHAYNSTGDDDPDPDSAANKYSRIIGGSALVQITGNGTGEASGDLGTTGDGHIEGNLSSPGFYAIGLSYDADWDNNDTIDFSTTNLPFLTVDYTAPGGSDAVPQVWRSYRGRRTV